MTWIQYMCMSEFFRKLSSLRNPETVCVPPVCTGKFGMSTAATASSQAHSASLMEVLIGIYFEIGFKTVHNKIVII